MSTIDQLSPACAASRGFENEEFEVCAVMGTGNLRGTICHKAFKLRRSADRLIHFGGRLNVVQPRLP